MEWETTKKNTFTTLSKMKLEHDYRFLMSVLIIPDFFSFTVNLPALIWNPGTQRSDGLFTLLNEMNLEILTNQTSTNAPLSRPSPRFRGTGIFPVSAESYRRIRPRRTRPFRALRPGSAGGTGFFPVSAESYRRIRPRRARSASFSRPSFRFRRGNWYLSCFR